jgi:hypothetical protein
MMKEYVFAIDPGTYESAYVLLEYPSMRPFLFDKISNEEMIVMIRNICFGYKLKYAAVEKIAARGMPVGQDTIDTAEWVGRFQQVLTDNSVNPMMIFRRYEQLSICGSMRANDASIHQALIDRFAYGVPNRGKGTKKEPGFFYGFRADIWQAFAVAVTARELIEEQERS